MLRRRRLGGVVPRSAGDALEEARVVRLLLDDDEEFLREFQRCYGARLLQMLKKTCWWLAEEVRQEIYQDTLLKVWEKRDRFDPERGSLRAWVNTIARNLATDRWRTEEGREYRAKAALVAEARARASPEFTTYRAEVQGVLKSLS